MMRLKLSIAVFSVLMAISSGALAVKGALYVDSYGGGYATGCQWHTIYSGTPAGAPFSILVQGLRCDQTGGSYVVVKQFNGGTCNSISLAMSSGYLLEGNCSQWAVYQDIPLPACKNSGSTFASNVPTLQMSTVVPQAQNYCGGSHCINVVAINPPYPNSFNILCK